MRPSSAVRPLVFLLLLVPHLLFAKDETLAVISYELAPFQTAWESFRQTFPNAVEDVHLAQGPLKIHGEPRVVVAFGGKAALEHYPESSVLIYCMAPGTFLRPADRRGPITQISMLPQPATALEKILQIQPALKRLTVLWIAASNEAFIADLRRAGQARGVTVLSDHILQPADLPDHLRRTANTADALWIPPDPLLISAQNVVLLSQFAASSHIPYYTSVAGLAEKGATASISSSYDEIGRTAALQARAALSGVTLPLQVYPEKVDTTLNITAAKAAGVHVSDPPLGTYEKVIP